MPQDSPSMTTNAVAPPAPVATVWKVQVTRVAVSKKPYPYQLQLCVGVGGERRSNVGVPQVFLPMALSGASGGASHDSLLALWNKTTNSIVVPKNTGGNWTLSEGDNVDFAECFDDVVHINFQLRKLMAAPSSGGKKAPRLPSLYPGEVAAACTTVGPQRFTLTFGKTAQVDVVMERLSIDEAAKLQTTPMQRNVALQEQTPTLAAVAAAMSTEARAAVEGSRVHRFLTEWSGALEGVGSQLAPIVEALPFGGLLVKAAAGLFAAVMGRGAVLELGADVCSYAALVLNVLGQPHVRDMIVEDPSTHTLLEQLVGAMEATMRILQGYKDTGVVRQLWNATSRLSALREKLDDMRAIFTLLHQLTSFRAQASNAQELGRLLRVADNVQLLTAGSLCEYMLPRLVRYMKASEGRTTAAIVAAKSDGRAAIGRLQETLRTDLKEMALDVLQRHTAMFEATNALMEAVAQVETSVQCIVQSSRDTTISVMTTSMRALLDEVVSKVLPAAVTQQVLDASLIKHLEAVVNSAWTAALQKQLDTSVQHVQAHATHVVTCAQVKISGEIDGLSKRLDAAVATTNAALATLGRFFEEALDAKVGGLQSAAQQDAKDIRSAVRGARLAVVDRIGVLHVDMTNITSEVHGQRRMLSAMHERLETMYENDGSILKAQAAITDVLDAIPANVRNALAPDVQRLHQQLRMHNTKSKLHVKELLDNSMTYKLVLGTAGSLRPRSLRGPSCGECGAAAAEGAAAGITRGAGPEAAV